MQHKLFLVLQLSYIDLQSNELTGTLPASWNATGVRESKSCVQMNLSHLCVCVQASMIIQLPHAMTHASLLSTMLA